MAHAIDVKAAKTNPSKFFKTPAEVATYPGISREDKIEILRQWETDARLMAVADEESMGGGENSHLGAVTQLLITLGDENKLPDADKTGTHSKLGG
jgi:hypothetical protein